YHVIAGKYSYKLYNNELVQFLHFFFSSRRRHTRSKRDWSSDVCSSDLFNLGWFGGADRRQGHGCCWLSQVRRVTRVNVKWLIRRSEERRVGKECRYRWAQN